MNLSLLDPFALAQEYPEALTHAFKWGHSACIKFNRKGDYLASGQIDGTIVIFDYETYGVVTTLSGHTRHIQSISWSRDGRYILSASRDWKCILWDLESGKAVKMVNLGAPVWGATLHPYNPLQFVASLYDDQAKLVDLSGDKPNVQALPTISSADGDKVSKEKNLTLVAIFSKSGKYIMSGTNRGAINVIDSSSLELIRSIKISSSNVKNLVLSSSGRSIVVNSSDRVIRLFHVPDFNADPETWDFDMEHKFQDVVNRLQWNSVAMSSSGEYVLATTYESAHDIYMWETSMGSLVKIYDGPKEELVDIQFHPNKPAVVANGLDTGTLYLWAASIPQKWSALAPDFVELEDNIEYEEREDEFDLADEEEENKRQLDKEEDVVDVITIEHSRGEYGEESFVIPLSLDDIEPPPDSDDDD